MSTIKEKSVSMPKPYLLEVLNNYFVVESNMEDDEDDNAALLELAKTQMVEDDECEDITGDELIALLRK